MRIIRGIAFLLMLIHHYYHFNPNSDVMPNIVENIGLVSRTLFIVLVGVSMRLKGVKKSGGVLLITPELRLRSEFGSNYPKGMRWPSVCLLFFL